MAFYLIQEATDTCGEVEGWLSISYRGIPMHVAKRKEVEGWLPISYRKLPMHVAKWKDGSPSHIGGY